MNKLSTALATATFAALPMMASAVTVNTDVSVGDAPSVSYSIPASGDGVTFSFTALENFSIDGFSITANGSNSGSDILASTYSVLGGTPLNFTNVFAVGAQGIGFRAPLKTSAPLQRVIARLREAIPALEADRYLAPDLQEAAALVREGDLVVAAGLEMTL